MRTNIFVFSSNQIASVVKSECVLKQACLLNRANCFQIPPLLIETLNSLNDNMFYSGCVIVEIRDYRIAASLTNYETKFVLLRPTQQVILIHFVSAKLWATFHW